MKYQFAGVLALAALAANVSNTHKRNTVWLRPRNQGPQLRRETRLSL